MRIALTCIISWAYISIADKTGKIDSGINELKDLFPGAGAGAGAFARRSWRMLLIKNAPAEIQIHVTVTYHDFWWVICEYIHTKC